MSKKFTRDLEKIDASIAKIRRWIHEDGHNMDHILQYHLRRRAELTSKIGKKVKS